MASLVEAFKGARVELTALPLSQRPQRIVQIARLFFNEIVGTVAMAPYGYHAYNLYNRLPAPPHSGAAAAASAASAAAAHPTDADDAVHLTRGVRYGPAPRNTLDIYTPASGASEPRPLVLFCHGGVWAAGEAWHYTPMAVQLARLGVVAVVMRYTLFPEALVPALVVEVGLALEFVASHAREYGADPDKVTLMGHSAGAHLCMMALLQRAREAHARCGVVSGGEDDGRAGSIVDAFDAGDDDAALANPNGAAACARAALGAGVPRQFVAIAGVFDVSKHYLYERGRGVEELSTMKRAIGGTSRFASMSPAVVLANTLRRGAASQAEAHQAAATSAEPALACGAASGPPPCFDFYAADCFSLSGEAIAHRIGLDRPCAGFAARDSQLAALALAGQEDVMDFPLGAAAWLPPTVLMSACTDVTVPWYESSEMYWRLYDCGVPVKHLVYNKVGHGDFVVNWRRPQQQQQRQGAAGPSHPDPIDALTAEDSDDYDEGHDTDPAPSETVAAGQSGARGVQASPSTARAGRGGAAGVLPQGRTPMTAEEADAELAGLPPYVHDIAKVVMGRVRVDWAHKQGTVLQSKAGAARVQR